MNGAQVYDLIEKIAATSSRNEKEALIAAHKDDERLRWVLRAAYDPFVTYGVIPARPAPAGGTKDLEEIFLAISDLLADLSSRRVTGNSAKELVQQAFTLLEPKSADLLWRILIKDLKAGFTDGTVNRVIPGHIPVFEVMLSHKYEPKRIKEWPVAAEPKKDGVRVIGRITAGTQDFVSRNGKPFPAMDHMRQAAIDLVTRAHAGARATIQQNPRAYLLYNWLGGDGGPQLILEGEAFGKTHFNETSGSVRRKSEQAVDVVYCLFDALNYDDFVADRPSNPYMIRRLLLTWLMTYKLPGDPFELLEMRECESEAELMAYFAEVRERGEEGLIVKPLQGRYEKKRSYNWLKIKAEETEDLYVVGAFEGEPETKYQGKLGGLIVDRAGVHVRVGGGFSDKEREDLWFAWLSEPAALVGRMMEVEYHEVTPDGSLRHPRFKRWRDDKAVAAAA